MKYAFVGCNVWILIHSAVTQQQCYENNNFDVITEKQQFWVQITPQIWYVNKYNKQEKKINLQSKSEEQSNETAMWFALCCVFCFWRSLEFWLYDNSSLSSNLPPAARFLCWTILWTVPQNAKWATR